MSINDDMKEIHGIFFEECSEGLDVMESGLLGLDLGAANLDVVNDIFRAAHSIKGGAATFGFLDISEFTHGVETLLDQVRAGERCVTEDAVEVLLQSVDCLRGMLDALKNEAEPESDAAKGIQARIESILEAEPEAPPAETDTPRSTTRWLIEFEPGPGILKDGNDPALILRELERLGSLDVQCHVDQLPALDEIDPEKCWLRWSLQLETDQPRNAIEEAFAWVSDDSSLEIKPKEKPKAEAATTGSRTVSIAAARDSGSIRVSTEKVDTLLNLVGELVITQSMLKRCGETYSPESVTDLRDGLMELERYTRELQESAMQIRMLPINVSFSRFPRLVRDLSASMGKKVDLRFSGENTELDKNVLEKLSDPLVHLVRNSLDHGIEAPADRLAAGKPEAGVLHLSASHENGNIVIRVEDDGAGINRERILAKARERGLVEEGEVLNDDQINNLIFQAGLSTAEQVSDVSGRGVGMDVVRNNIKDLSGRLEVQSEAGKGSVITICLPLTLAILDGQLARIGDDVYIFALQSIVETVQASREEVVSVLGAGKTYRVRDRYIPVVRLRDAFNLGEAPDDLDSELLVIVESDGELMGLFVDDLLEQQQVVIKSLEENYRKVDGLAGATILGDGRVALIVDVPSLMQQLCNTNAIKLAGSTAA